MKETKKHFHRICPAPGIYWVRSGWMWEGEFSAAGALMTMSALKGWLWQCVSAVRWMLASWQKFCKLLIFAQRYTLCVLSQVNYLVLTLRQTKVTTALVWTCPEYTESVLNTCVRTSNHLFRTRTVGMVLDRGKTSSSDCAPWVCSRQFTFVTCAGVWPGWAWEQNTAYGGLWEATFREE